ncbi:MAG: hybrid sensor histidine kinase/response regulator [Coleofasciculus sp. A1-SPW-01]|uniref:response regulator n=1 Tax=Coleofasciculus sp. A1-SPW-01 TaxID=3070819 RepID=UPI0032F13887
MNDPNIREQSYHYFLEEAPELMGIIEQELLDLRTNFSVNKVHHLMRTTHTLKGAAASVELDTIKTVAHSLEDIFKTLFNPDVVIDAEVEALLFEGYECLRLPLTAEVMGGKINEAEVLDRTAAVFAKLQEKLGDCFDQQANIPSSLELGFDVTQSIFEVGVSQRLDQITEALASNDPSVMADTLRSQAEVLLGVAESMNLPGFAAIASSAIAALENYPDQAEMITQIALADFQAGQKAVLDGDRTQGGQPSQSLQELAGVVDGDLEDAAPVAAPENVWEADLSDSEVSEELAASDTYAADSAYSDEEFSQRPITDSADFQLDATDLTPLLDIDINEYEDYSVSEPETEGVEEPDSADLLDSVWGNISVSESTTEEDVPVESESESEEVFPVFKTPAHNFQDSIPESVPTPPVDAEEPLTDYVLPSPRVQQESVPETQPQTVRVNIDHLEHLNYSVGELLTYQNRQSLQDEQLQSAVRLVLTRLQQHQQLLDELQDWHDRQLHRSQQKRMSLRGRKRREAIQEKPSLAWQNPQTTIPNYFDPLELDSYNEPQLLIQSLMDDTAQLTEATESIEVFASQFNQTFDKQRRLLTSIRDTLMEARLLPLGTLFRRFPRVLQQLEVTHNKSVELYMDGTEVLVDKVVVQKLYDPLLHLIRNAFDHGIESPEVRQESGKTRQGTIAIDAYHQNRYLVIEVRDDGQGLNFEKIRQRAVEQRLIDAEKARQLSPAELAEFLFEPGFSTASGLSDLSGRGIGMDVVRSQVESLQGSVTVYSQPYYGTTFRLQIPLNLTIAKLLLMEAGGQTYALLSDAIEQIIIPPPERLRCWDEGKVLRWGTGKDEQLIPIFSLAEVLDYHIPQPKTLVLSSQRPLVEQTAKMSVILIRCQNRLLGLEVNQLVGEQELVIRPLGSMIAPPDYVYGGCILADGGLALVLDGTTLMQSIADQQTAKSPPEFTADFQSSMVALTGSTSVASDRNQRQLSPSRPAALPAAPEPPPPTPTPRRSPQLLLVVDDSITVRQSLTFTLQKAGYQILQAKDGYEAIEQLQNHGEIQVVICDIEMPRMNGFEFLKYRQQEPELAKIPVLILTSRSSEKHRLIATELGANDYITKPFLEPQLLETVQQFIKA